MLFKSDEFVPGIFYLIFFFWRGSDYIYGLAALLSPVTAVTQHMTI